MQSTAEQILSARDLAAPETVEVPKWGRKVTVHEMTGMEREQWEQVAFGPNARKDLFRASLLVHTLKDEQQERIFAPDQAEALAAKSAIVIGQLYDVAARLNGLRKSDEDAAAKNS